MTGWIEPAMTSAVMQQGDKVDTPNQPRPDPPKPEPPEEL